MLRSSGWGGLSQDEQALSSKRQNNNNEDLQKKAQTATKDQTDFTASRYL